MTGVCYICLGPARARRDGHEPVCSGCRGWRDYYESLSPAQRLTELRMMDRHAAGSLHSQGGPR